MEQSTARLSRKTSLDQLSPKRRLFVAEYIKSLNATDAYRKAGYECRSLTVARTESSKLLTNPHIEREIASAIAAREQRSLVTGDKVLLELARIGFSDMRDYLEWGPDGVRLKPSSELTDDQAHAVLKVTERITKEGRYVSFELADKIEALDRIAKMQGLYKESDVSGLLAERKTVRVTDETGRTLFEHISETISQRLGHLTPVVTAEPEQIAAPEDDPETDRIITL